MWTKNTWNALYRSSRPFLTVKRLLLLLKLLTLREAVSCLLMSPFHTIGEVPVSVEWMGCIVVTIWTPI
jgi:hypothetical protein